MSGQRRLAVLGSPIGHSKSPALQRAAYGILGLAWDYEAIEVKPGELREFLASLDESWRGLSITMPLKREVVPLLGRLDAAGTAVGAANTVLFDGGRVLGFNTDVYGIGTALREVGIGHVPVVRILGSGATAASVLLAVNGMGARSVEVSTRSPERATDLRELALALGMDFGIGSFDTAGFDAARFDAAQNDAARNGGIPDVVISTLPGDAALVREFPADFRARVPLVEVAYDPWPTPLAQHWLEVGGTVHSGLGMLIHQALAQVRVFVGGDPGVPLRDEQNVLAAMREAVGPDSAAGSNVSHRSVGE